MLTLHLAIDCRVVDPHFPGIGRATLEMVRALLGIAPEHHYSLMVGPGELHPALAELGRRPEVELISVGSMPRSPRDQIVLPRLLAALRPTLYHATYYAVPALLPVPTIVTIYDLIPQLFPRYWPNPRARYAINAWTAYAARRAQRIIVCSQSTRHDLARWLPSTAPRIHVAPLGVTMPAPDERSTTSPQPPYLLYVGSNKPHKNLPRLIESFARLTPSHDASLIIAGAWDERYAEARERVDRLGLTDRVRFEHRPSDQRLQELYAAATGFVFPSRYEGFGLPVLEAMSHGLPVATSARGSLGEVAGDAALLFNPDKVEEMSAALARLLDDAELRHTLGSRGRERARQYSWERTASATASTYRDLAHELR